MCGAVAAAVVVVVVVEGAGSEGGCGGGAAATCWLAWRGGRGSLVAALGLTTALLRTSRASLPPPLPRPCTPPDCG